MAVEPSGGTSVTSPPGKGAKSSGNGTVGSTVHDPDNGVPCHQCRHKTRDIAAACQNQSIKRTCAVKLCSKCLLNRYGEKVEEVAGCTEWVCPKCRGICNCSVCMKRRGHQPTGLLNLQAKATGFGSVSELLLKTAERVNHENVGTDINASLEKELVSYPRKRMEENSSDGKLGAHLPKSAGKKAKKVKGLLNDKAVDNTTSNICNKELVRKRKEENSSDGNLGAHLPKSAGKKAKKVKGLHNDKAVDNTTSNICNKELVSYPKKRKEENSSDGKLGAHLPKSAGKKAKKVKGLLNDKAVDNTTSNICNKVPDRIELSQDMPKGTDLTSVAGIDVPSEDVGNALEFIEFCSIFGKILELKDDEAGYVLRDIFHGRGARQGKLCATVQFHVHLLRIIQTEKGEKFVELSASYGKKYWFEALKRRLSESQLVLKALQVVSLEKAADYEDLNASEKLRVLNQLCTEVLGTKKLRNWIEDQYQKTRAKQKVLDGKIKAREQKMKDDIAKPIDARDGDQEAVVSHTKSEAAQAHAKLLEPNAMFLKINQCQTAHAVRVEPVFMGQSGHVYWELNSSGQCDVLRQYVGKGDTHTLNEKWFSLNAEEKEVMKKYIKSKESITAPGVLTFV